MWAYSYEPVCRGTALTQAGAVCVCVCVCVCVYLGLQSWWVCVSVCVYLCVCVVWAYSYEPVCGGTALTQAGAVCVSV